MLETTRTLSIYPILDGLFCTWLLIYIFSFQLDGRNVTVDKYPKGNFMGPTILTNMNTSMTAYKTEIFGPVLCVISVDTLEEAIEVKLALSTKHTILC